MVQFFPDLFLWPGPLEPLVDPAGNRQEHPVEPRHESHPPLHRISSRRRGGTRVDLSDYGPFFLLQAGDLDAPSLINGRMTDEPAEYLIGLKHRERRVKWSAEVGVSDRNAERFGQPLRQDPRHPADFGIDGAPGEEKSSLGKIGPGR